jgi:acyl-coenzyme A synthetase/AMP-(fatty) acid ligase
VLDFYGLTESYPLCANFPFMKVREGSMGKPMPGWDVAILDEDERPVAQGDGEGSACAPAPTRITRWGTLNRPAQDTEERRGNVVKAFVVLAAGQEPSDALGEEIKAFVREHLSAYAYPRLIEFVPDLPKTLTGKIRRIELRQREPSPTASD